MNGISREDVGFASYWLYFLTIRQLRYRHQRVTTSEHDHIIKCRIHHFEAPLSPVSLLDPKS